MENQDAVNFVEAYRHHCKKQIAKAHNLVIKPSEVPIAQLLCEEARYRWRYIVAEEDTMVDDIGCIIVEFEHGTQDKLSKIPITQGTGEMIISPEENTLVSKENTLVSKEI